MKDMIDHFDTSDYKENNEYGIPREETRLLPSPYESNCTDYLQTWRERGGKAPVNQLGVFQECRVNKTLESVNCIPLDIDYPHTYNVCRACTEECPPPVNVSECSMLTERYNQPCDSITYTVSRKRKAVYVYDDDGIEKKVLERNCSGRRMWDQECFLIDIEAIFDKFEVTKYTYKPKFENLELFSVIGGYMGMWLGISLLGSYDIILDTIIRINKQRKRKSQIRNFHDKNNSNEFHFKLPDSVKTGTNQRQMKRMY
ncbi:uncharacterized protein LOC129223181 [Uloborus diversus]|uniref:uncharacterized protein LOC129223181 n=1 Tax=Uloborus diversus TaxID=327109 RepID=UPI002409F930|nr:uncharacterized protein LOC129223181 [Uloborus diversus]